MTIKSACIFSARSTLINVTDLPAIRDARTDEIIHRFPEDHPPTFDEESNTR